MAGISSVTSQTKLSINWTAQENVVGTAYNPITNATTLTKAIAIGTANANNNQAGGDEVYSALTLLAASGATSVLDLTNLVNVVGNSFGFARVKEISIQNMSTSDDANYGGLCSQINIGGSGQATPFLGWISSGSQHQVPNGGIVYFGTTTSGGYTVASGTNSKILIQNGDSVNSGCVQITVLGGSS